MRTYYENLLMRTYYVYYIVGVEETIAVCDLHLCCSWRTA